MTKLIKTNTPREKIHNRGTHIADYWRCPECGTEYPEMEVYSKADGEFYMRVMCNGVEVSECPFCKEAKYSSSGSPIDLKG